MKNRVLKLGLGGGLATVFGGIVWGGFIADTEVCQQSATPGEYVVYSARTRQTIATMKVTPQEGQPNPMGSAIVNRAYARPSPADILSVEINQGFCALYLNDAPAQNRETRIFPLLLGIKGP
jgi:hypothetical protein